MQVSRSTWACELKWYFQRKSRRAQKSRSTWACELKFELSGLVEDFKRSRSTWACELKCDRRSYRSFTDCHAPRERVSWNVLHIALLPIARCHAPRERVSWNTPEGTYVPKIACHAPRERVSWNLNCSKSISLFCVTLHVSVWVEIYCDFKCDYLWLVTLHLSVWVNFRFNAGLKVYVIRSDHSKCCVVFKACSKRRLSWI